MTLGLPPDFVCPFTAGEGVLTSMSPRLISRPQANLSRNPSSLDAPTPTLHSRCCGQRAHPTHLQFRQ